MFGDDDDDNLKEAFEEEELPDKVGKTLFSKTTATGTNGYYSPEFADLCVRRDGETRQEFGKRKRESDGYSGPLVDAFSLGCSLVELLRPTMVFPYDDLHIK